MTKRTHKATQTYLLLASVAFSVGSYGAQGSLLSSNGTFDSGQEGFGTYLPNNSALATFNGEASFDIQAVQENAWEVQFSHPGFAITQGSTYTLCFSAKASANRTLITYIDADGTPNYSSIVTGDTQVSLTTTYQNYTYTFSANQTDDSARLVFNMGLNSASVQLDNINVYEGTTCGAEPTDGDSDGILDDEDLCPSTPPNVSVDTHGCPIQTTDTYQIEAENYTAASDTSIGNSGAPTQCTYNGLDADIENTTDTGGGCNLGWIDAGEWVEYGLALPAGVYTVSARVASDLTGGTFSMLIDGSEVAIGTVTNTGGWQVWDTITLGSVTVGSGAQTLRLEMASADFNINWLLFEPINTATDSDADGVNDDEDQCPSTPAGAAVDTVGCPLDSDGDGVFDGLDQCLSTPEGAVTDVNGCPLDSDDDGVYDGLDQCPQTAPGLAVDANGCAILVDTDGDGVNDAADTCPATPQGALVDTSGCPIDSDGDGVFDGLDQCPGTPSGASVDALGCKISSDSDNDGIDDANDQCPGTPTGIAVDTSGCPLPQDSDGDGVFDENDDCPGTAPNVSVDAAGCQVDAQTELQIEAENYTAASDNSVGNEGAISDCNYNGLDVDVEDTLDTGGGCNVGWINANEWLEYSINLVEGAYTLSARVATDTAGSSFTVLIDDTEIVTTTLPTTGGWQVWETVTVADINLSPGPHTLRIKMNTSWFNLNWLSIEPAGALADADGDGVIDADDLCPQTSFGAMVDLQGCALISDYKIEAEAYSAASDNTAGNSGAPTQCDYNGLDVDVENASDAGDGCNVGWLNAGEWLEYTFELSHGTYALTARVAAAQNGGAYTLLIDDEPLFNQSVDSTQGWQTWTTQSLGDVTLAGGSHTLRIEITAAGFNINWLEFTHSAISPDSDGDGVTDDTDHCPQTPSGTEVDENGCTLVLDTDGDGIDDTVDQCPGTPADTSVDTVGCALPQDSDGDGIVDAQDQCPGTPFGTAVDGNGCALAQDADGDGVDDTVDQCQGTPSDTPVDAVGCALPQDSDGDGVIDSLDQCPGTPSGTEVDVMGCPLPTDSDNDGVEDGIDQCPDTQPGASVDANGCETTATLPVRIEAEDYTDAADTTPGNEGSVTQCVYNGLDTDVEDTLDSEGNCNLGWIEAGEWVEYSLPASAGRYLVSIRVASANDGGAFTLSLDGNLLTSHTVTSTGGWQTWQTQSLGEVDIPAGAQTLRMDVDTSWFSLNWLEFTPLELNDTDTDGDGVLDSADQCPGTPTNTPVNAEGCELGSVPPWTGTPPAMSDFQTIPLAVGINLPMQLEISKAGDLYVIGRLGHFYAFENGELVEKSILATNSFEEGGLIGMALDPNFLTNRYAYFHYTDPTDPVHHISRIPINPDNTLNVAAESILLSYGVQQQFCCHMGGAMVFDALGNLYISTGDNTDPYSSDDYAPIDERPNQSPQDSQKSSANTNDLRGKILRITPTADGGYSLPPGNLFAPDALHRGEIYTMGNRNPFRIAIDSQTNWLYWADVGPNAGAGDPSRGPAGYDEINRTNQAGNFGWPYFAGNNEAYVDYDFATGISGAPFNPTNVINDSPNNTGALNLPDAQPAWHVMSHRATMLAGIYRWDDSIDDPFKLPSYFHGRLIYWNFNNDEVFETDVTQNTAQPRLWLDNDLVGGIIDGEISAHNNRLYMLAYGANCCSSPPYAGVLMEVRYTGTGPDVITPKTYYAVNVAGDAYSAANGTDYEPHNYVYEGNLQTVSTAIANTEDDTLYQTQLWLDGDLSFEFPVEDGTYDVQIQMADIFFDAPGERSFHIDLEGQRVVTNLDIVAEIGANTAYDRYFTTTVNDGILNLNFIQSVENPTVAGIVIRKQGDYTPGKTIVMKASNGQFVAATNPPVANRVSVNNDTIFAIESTGTGNIALRSVTSGLYLGQSNGGTVILSATSIGTDQSFNLVETPDGSYVIRTINGQYVSADSGGTLQLVATVSGTTDFTLHLADECTPDPSYGLSCRPFAEPYLNMPADAAPDLSNVPTLLSQTGAFSDVGNLIPASSFVPYEPISPLWSDRAVKSRWVSVPSGQKVGFQAEGKWQWPEGTVFLKHFALPVDEADPSNLRRLETRITVIQPGGSLYGVTYKWRADGSDADLLTTVFNEDITISAPGGDWTQTWTYPSPNDCLTCHNEDTKGVLGPKTAALNKEWLYPSGVTTNQLATWNHLGLFDQALDEGALNTLPAHAHIGDTTKTLEHRVRSYWDSNCSQCHGPQGIASNWDARFETPLAEQGVVLGAVAEHRDYLADYGLANPFVVDPGNPDNSILYIRDQSVDPDDRMPPLGRRLEDAQYMDVLEQWINGLP